MLVSHHWGQVIVLFTDGENNSGREPYIGLERARKNGVRVYRIGVELQSNASEQLALAVPMTGGKSDNVRRTTDLEQALTDINEVEKGVFYTLSLTRNEARLSHLCDALADLAGVAHRPAHLSPVCRDHLRSDPINNFKCLPR